MIERVQFQVRLHITCITLLLFASGCDSPEESPHIDLSAADELTVVLIQKHQELIEGSPQNAIYHGELGIVYELHGFPEAAIRKYEDAISIDPDNPKWHYFRALIAAHRNGAKAAIEDIDRVLELDDLYVPAWLWRGTWMLDLAQSREAEISFSRARDLGSYLPSKVGLARVKLQQGNVDAAIDDLNDLVDAYQLPYLKQLLGVAYSQSGQTGKAGKLLKEVHDAPPLRWRDPWVEDKSKFLRKGLAEELVIAQQFVSRGMLEEALELLRPLRESHPESIRVVRTLAVVLRLYGESEEALALLDQVLEEHPTQYMLHFERAQLLIGQGRLSSALDSLQNAISIDANLVEALKLKGEILMRQKKWQAAKQALMSALKIDSTNVKMIVDAGWTTGMLNQWEEAANLFQHAIFVDRNYIPAYVNLARALTVMGKYQDARSVLDDALELGAAESHIEATRRQINEIESGRS